jgi:hypothetical protein
VIRHFRRRAARRALEGAKRRALGRSLDKVNAALPFFREVDRLLAEPWDAPGRTERLRAATARLNAHNAAIERLVSTRLRISRRLERSTR